MRLFFLFLLLLGSVHHSIADHFTDKKTKTDTNLTGHVIDKNTGEHIPFFTVSLKGTTLGTATDETGHYFLKNLPIGTLYYPGKRSRLPIGRKTNYPQARRNPRT